MKSNYIVTNPSIKSFNTTVADADLSVEVIGAANEVFAVDQAERVWRARNHVQSRNQRCSRCGSQCCTLTVTNMHHASRATILWTEFADLTLPGTLRILSASFTIDDSGCLRAIVFSIRN